MLNEDALLLDVGDVKGVLREGVSSVASAGSASTLSRRVSNVTRNDTGDSALQVKSIRAYVEQYSRINQQRGTEVLLCWLIPQTSNHRISARVFQSKSVVSRRRREALAIVGVIRYTSDTAHEGYERHATPEYEQSALHEQQTIGRRPPCPLLVAGLGTRVFRVVTSSKAISSDYK